MRCLCATSLLVGDLHAGVLGLEFYPVGGAEIVPVSVTPVATLAVVDVVVATVIVFDVRLLPPQHRPWN